MLTTAQTKAVKIATEAGLRVEVEGSANRVYTSTTVSIYFDRADVDKDFRELVELDDDRLFLQAVKVYDSRAKLSYRHASSLADLAHEEVAAGHWNKILNDMAARQVEYTNAFYAKTMDVLS